MLFSDLYKSTKSPLSRLRQHAHSIPSASPDYDADLVSRDKAKQKEAVKRFLAAKIRHDWEFTWPPPAEAQPCHKAPVVESSETYQQESNEVDHLSVQDLDSDHDDTASSYSVISEDATNWRTRAEWWSDLSDDEPAASPSAYRFDSPDSVGAVIKASALAKCAKRRRAIRQEEAWNPGLACFNARRDAWTSAKKARVKPKPQTIPSSPSSTHRLSFWRSSVPTSPMSPTSASLVTSPISPVATRTSGDMTAISSSDADSKENPSKTAASLYPVETLLPLPAPLLPPANPMRASITPATYPSIYDRIVVHSMTPACPVNLADVLRSCVAGWKRDGEWPPRPVDAPTTVVAVRKKKRDSNSAHPNGQNGARRMSFGFLGRKESPPQAAQATNIPPPDSPEDGGVKGIRKSIQKALGLGHERTTSNMSHNGAIIG